MIERDRVEMTKLGVERLCTDPCIKHSTRGILISQRGDFVWVLRDDRKTIKKYHKDFWEDECPL